MEFTLRSIDPVLSRCAAPGAARTPRGMRFERQGAFSAALMPRTLLGSTPTNDLAASVFERDASVASSMPVGILELSNVYLMGPQGLILDPLRRACWIGNLAGWRIGGLQAFFRNVLQLPFGKTIVIDDALLAAAERCGPTTLWGAPGFDVYGHWLLDFLPRLHRIRAAELPGPLYYPRMPRWGTRLLDDVFPGHGVAANSAQQRRLTFHERITFPTMLKYKGIVEGSFTRRCWAEMATRLTALGGSGARTPPRLFVSRSRCRVRAGLLENAAEVERRFAEAGFEVIHPEALSFPEQRAVFAGARAVAGEDGSGLHNTLYSAPGTRLGVVCTTRVNPLLLSCVNTLEQHVTFVPTEPLPGDPAGRRRADLAEIDAAIDLLTRSD